MTVMMTVVVVVGGVVVTTRATEAMGATVIGGREEGQYRGGNATPSTWQLWDLGERDGAVLVCVLCVLEYSIIHYVCVCVCVCGCN